MRKILIVIMSVAMATLFVGCSLDDETSTSYLQGTPVSVSTPQEAENALSSFSGINSGASASPAPARAIALAQSLSPSRVASLAPISVTCDNGGTYVGDYTDSSNFNATYTNCQFGTITMNGSVSASNNTIVLSNYQYSDSSTGENLIMNFTVTSSDPDDVTINGTISYTDASDSASFGYENFHMIVKSNGDENINGKISITSNTFSCVNGVLDITTVVDLTPDLSGGYSSGTMKINGATFVFNANNTVSVTFPDGTTQTLNQNQPPVCS